MHRLKIYATYYHLGTARTFRKRSCNQRIIHLTGKTYKRIHQNRSSWQPLEVIFRCYYRTLSNPLWALCLVNDAVLLEVCLNIIEKNHISKYNLNCYVENVSLEYSLKPSIEKY